MTSSQVTPASVHWNKDGTPVSHFFDDIYFSTEGGIAESRYVFLLGNQLPERFFTFHQREFMVAETGFGTGLNFFVLWEAFNQFRVRFPDSPLQSLRFLSFERYPFSPPDLTRAHRHFAHLNHLTTQFHAQLPALTSGRHACFFENVQLDLIYGDVNDMIAMLDPLQDAADAWFLDGFAPQKNPQMWTESLFSHIFRLTKSQGTLATFTAAGFVRRGLESAGFSMHKRKGFERKREMLVGIRQ